jgi:hypothetical protein
MRSQASQPPWTKLPLCRAASRELIDDPAPSRYDLEENLVEIRFGYECVRLTLFSLLDHGRPVPSNPHGSGHWVSCAA